MKLKFRLLGLLSTMALLLVIALIPMNAKAAVSFKGVASGTTVAMPAQGGNNYYKIKLTEDSLLALQYSNVTLTSYVKVYKEAAMENNLEYTSIKGTGRIDLALKKGTYYINMYEGYSGSTPTGKMKFSVVAANKINKDNYCRAKCIAVDAYAVQKICATPTYDYTRWYKFTIKSAKKVSVVTTEGLTYRFDILSTNLQRYNVDTTGNYTKITTRDKLAPGTYYIRVSEYGSYTEGVSGKYFTFKWK